MDTQRMECEKRSRGRLSLQELVGGGPGGYRFLDNGPPVADSSRLYCNHLRTMAMALELHIYVISWVAVLGDVAAAKTRHACSDGLELNPTVQREAR